MGQDPGTDGTAVTQEPDRQQLRSQIDDTRHELGDAVASLAEKADVSAQAKRKVEETKAAIDEKRRDLLGKARSASPDGAASAAAGASQKAREKPLPLAAGGAFLLGLLLGRRRRDH